MPFCKSNQWEAGQSGRYNVVVRQGSNLSFDLFDLAFNLSSSRLRKLRIDFCQTEISVPVWLFPQTSSPLVRLFTLFLATSRSSLTAFNSASSSARASSAMVSRCSCGEGGRRALDQRAWSDLRTMELTWLYTKMDCFPYIFRVRLPLSGACSRCSVSTTPASCSGLSG